MGMKRIKEVTLLLGLSVLPACDRGAVEWVEDTFEQSKTHDVDKKMVKKYLKSVRVYDQFDTIAIFDVLWLSNDIRSTYSSLHSTMAGMSKEASIAFLRRQLKATEHYVNFYILSTDNIVLNATPAPWMVTLKVGEKKYAPLEIKVLDMSPEYKTIFGSLLTNHKRPYEIKFDRKDADGKDIMSPAIDHMTLSMSSPTHYVDIEFPLEGQITYLVQENSVPKNDDGIQDNVVVPDSQNKAQKGG